MDGPIEGNPHAALSDYLAAERTVLAWIRTGLALMGFGFVVARFGLFLQQLQAVQNASSAKAYGLSLWFGTALIAVGVFVNLFAGWQHARLVRLLDRGDPVRSRPAGPAVTIAVFPGIGWISDDGLSDFSARFCEYSARKHFSE